MIMNRILFHLLVITAQFQHRGLVKGQKSSQLQWQQRSSYTNLKNKKSFLKKPFSNKSSIGRHHPITFANETHGFVLGGSTIGSYPNSYIYKEATDTWTEVRVNSAFTPRSFGYGVVLNELNHPKAYLGFGAALGSGERLNDFWEIDMTTLQWRQLDSCPGVGRRHPSMVPVYDGSSWQIHVGLGDGVVNGQISNLNDYWSYNIVTDQWTQLPDFPSTARHHPFFFGINETSYVGLGHSSGPPLTIERDFFSYSTDSSTWNREPDFESYSISNDGETPPVVTTTEARVAGTEFSIVLPLIGVDESNDDNSALSGSIGFVLSGYGDDHGPMGEGEFHAFYKTPLNNEITWRQLPPHPGESRWAPGSFVIRGTARAYFTSGYARSTRFLYSDVWMMDLSCLLTEQQQQQSDTGTTTSSCVPVEEQYEYCGSNMCAQGEVCCNESCGICTEPDGGCAALFCEPSPSICFSPYAKTNILGKGRLPMKDIVVGDKVLTANGKYETIFTLNHFHHSKATDYLQIHIDDLEGEQPIEITPNHMLFIEGYDYPVPASQIKVDDFILSAWIGPRKVIRIEKITRNGLYSPLTSGGDGTMIVDGIVASTYTSYTGNTHIETSNGIKVMSFHEIMDITCSPYRALCNILPSRWCNNYHEVTPISDTGIATELRNAMKFFFTVWSKQKFTIQFVLLFVYLSIFSMLSILLKYFWVNNIILAVLMIKMRSDVKYNKER